MLSWLVDLGVFAGGADGGCEADGLRLRLTAVPSVPSVGAGEVSMMARGMAAASAGARKDKEEEEGPGKGSRKAEASPHTHAARAHRRNSGCPGVGECEIPSAQRQRLSPPTCSACPAGSELRHTYGTRVPPVPSHDGGPISATCPVLDHPLLKRRIDVRSLAHRSPSEGRERKRSPVPLHPSPPPRDATATLSDKTHASRPASRVHPSTTFCSSHADQSGSEISQFIQCRTHISFQTSSCNT